MIKVVLVDDYAFVREGLKVLLGCYKSLEVVGEADGSESLLHLFAQGLLCDVVLLDLFLDGTPSGLDVITTLCNLPRSPQILMVSMCTDQVLVTECLRLGARGFLAKMDAAEHIGEAIQTVSHNIPYVSPSVHSVLLDKFDNQCKPDLDELTPQEMEVLGLLGEGYSTRRMAKMFRIASRDIDDHMEQLKINVNFAQKFHSNVIRAVWNADNSEIVVHPVSYMCLTVTLNYDARFSIFPMKESEEIIMIQSFI